MTFPHCVSQTFTLHNKVWIFKYLSAIQILREINFEVSGISKTAIFAILGAVNFVHLGNFTLAKVQKCIKNQIQSLCMCVKWLILHFKNPQNWFHVKSEWQKNHEISTLCTMLQKISKCEVKVWLCWNLMILPPLQFCVKLNFGKFIKSIRQF